MLNIDPIIKELSQQENVILCRFSEDEHLLRQGDEIKYVYFLLEGLCCQYIIRESGEEHVLMIQGGDDTVWSLLGAIYCFSDGISGMNFEARTECICYQIPKDVIVKYLKAHNELLIELLKQSMELYSNLYEYLNYKWQRNTVGQLCQFLLDKAEQKDDMLIIDKTYSNIRISQFLGIHNITASRILKSLKDNGSIKRSARGIIIVKPEDLKNYITGEKKLNYYRKEEM